MDELNIEVFPTCKSEALALAYVLKMDKNVTKPEDVVDAYEDALQRIRDREAKRLTAAIQAGNFL